MITSFNGKQYPVCVRECENKWEQFLNRSFPNAPLSEVNESKDDEDIKESDDDSEENSDDEGVLETWINQDKMEGLEEGEIGMEEITTTRNVASSRYQMGGEDESWKVGDRGEALITEAKSSEDGEVPSKFVLPKTCSHNGPNLNLNLVPTLGRTHSPQSIHGPSDPLHLENVNNPTDRETQIIN